MNVKYERQMKKGVLEILVLHLLKQETMYGYQLIQELKERSNGLFTLKEGTLYPILYRLEEDHCITCKWKEPRHKEVPRKYYEITQDGMNLLEQLYTLWYAFSEEVIKMLEEDES